MKRRDLIRAGVLTGAAAALRPPLARAQGTAPPSELTPAQSGVDASKDLAAPGWKPLFLDEHQNETLIVLSDLIIPATDTPGAKEALVNRYIDLVLAAETHENQRAFLEQSRHISTVRACGDTKRRFAICREKIRTICCTRWRIPTRRQRVDRRSRRRRRRSHAFRSN